MGKRKTMNGGSGGDSQHSPSTVFVANLPFSITSAQLEETFSEVGPIRRCFMVMEKGSKEHRGFGYVQFAVVEDANRAIELKNNSIVGDRKIVVKQAMHRASLEKRRPKENQGLLRQSYLVVFLTITWLTKFIGELAILGQYRLSFTLFQRKILTSMGWLQEGCRKNASSVLFTSVKSACACVAALHQKEIHGRIIWARQLGGEGSKTQKIKNGNLLSGISHSRPHRPRLKICLLLKDLSGMFLSRKILRRGNPSNSRGHLKDMHLLNSHQNKKQKMRV